MIRVGEETGTLETQLEVTAQYYEGELDYKLKKLTAIFEPAKRSFTPIAPTVMARSVKGAAAPISP